MEKHSYPLLNSEFNRMNLHIIENGLFTGDKSWAFNDVVSSFNRMYFIISGDGYVEKDSVKYFLEAGKIYLIPAGAKFNYNCSTEIRKFYLHFQLEILPGVDIFQGLPEYL